MRISIITAVLNNREHIRGCIQSVLRQSYRDVEYLIVDGGSTDGTIEIIREFENKITKWTTGRDDGIYDALNKGISLATGEVVGFLHSDDYYNDEEVVRDVADAFVNHKVEAVYGDLVYVSKADGRPIRYWESSEYKDEKLKLGWMPPHPTLFVKKSVYERCGSFDARFKVSADYDLVLRIFGKHKIRSYYLPRVLVRMRLGGNSNKSIRNLVRKSLEDHRATKLNGLKLGFLVVLFKNLSKLPQFFFNADREHSQSSSIQIAGDRR